MTYMTLSLEQAAKQWPNVKDDWGDTLKERAENERYGDPWLLIAVPDSGDPTIIGEDGGEPEDQTLTRDWSWVVGALNDAYQKGKADA